MSHPAVRWLLAALLLAVAGAPAAASAAITAAVEPRIIDELDTARLTIRATGSNETQRLDLEALEQDFEVLTTQSASQYRAVNGQVESWVEYQIMLRPRSAGDITIPAIRVGAESTTPLTLRVRGIEPELREAIDRMVFFETELTANPVYVQAQTIMVRRLFYSSGAQIYSDLPGLPDIPDAIVVPLGETTSNTTVLDGQRYGVVEQRFAILPEQSGELTIPAISVTSSVRLQSDGRTRRSGVRIATEPMLLQVLPIPPEYPADHPWLPAEDVTVSDRWTPDPSRLDVGDPLRRTISVRVEGNVSSAIPPLDPSLPDAHFRHYPEPPALRDDSRGTSVRGLREQSYAIIPTAPGTVRLPATQVVWWDVRARAVRTALAESHSLAITGTPARSTDDADAASGTATASAFRQETPAADANSGQVPAPGSDQGRPSWLALLAAVIIAIALAWLWHRFGAAAFTRTFARTFGRSQWSSRRAAWRALKHACRDDDAAAVHQALQSYLRVYYQAPLAESVQRFRDGGSGPLLDALNAGRYRPGEGTAVRGQQVLRAVRELRRRRPGFEALPALYD